MKCKKLLAEHGVYPECEKLFCAFMQRGLGQVYFAVSSPRVQILHIRFRMTINVSLIMALFHPIVILNGGKNAL